MELAREGKQVIIDTGDLTGDWIEERSVRQTRRAQIDGIWGNEIAIAEHCIEFEA